MNTAQLSSFVNYWQTRLFLYQIDLSPYRSTALPQSFIDTLNARFAADAHRLAVGDLRRQRQHQFESRAALERLFQKKIDAVGAHVPGLGQAFSAR
jgi:hypothetical protein